MGRTVATVLAVIITWLAITSIVATPGGALIDDPDLDTSAEYLYHINTNAGVVEVRIELVMTADKPNLNLADGSYYQYYFDTYTIPIPVEAEELRVTDSGGRDLIFERSELPGADLLEINLRRNLFYRQSATVIIEFDLAAGPAGSDEPTRINPATASFVAWTSPSLEQATVTVSAPPGFVDQSDGFVPFDRVADGTELRFVAEDVDPETYFTLVSLTNDDALVVKVIPLEIDGEEESVQVRWWPGDTYWRDQVTEGVEVGVPLLVELVGQPWPIDGELTITESFSPYLSGYAGWYDPDLDVIEIGDDPDLLVLYHELSHVWFHRDLFTDRWITEGLADYFGASAVEARGETRPKPELATQANAASIPLMNFTPYIADPEEERWAYGASWKLMESIVDEVGAQAMIGIIDAAQRGEYSYLGDGEPETTKITPGTRRFLDLIENAQEVEHGPVTDLFNNWVFGQEDNSSAVDRAALAERPEARTRYFDLVDGGKGWAAPVGIRSAMTFWRFDEANDLMAEAEDAITQKDELIDLVGPTGAELPVKLEQLYEAAHADYDQFAAAVGQISRAGSRVREADDRADEGRSFLQQVGLIGTDLEAEAEHAIMALERGQLGPAISEAAEVETILDGAQRAGVLRLAVAATALLSILVGGGFFTFRRLRGRRRLEVPTVELGNDQG